MSKEKNENDILKRSFISTLIFIFIVLVVFYFIFKDNNYKEVYQIFLGTNKFYLLLAIICMSFFSVCEALNLKTALNLFGDKVSFKDSYKYALSGFFVASITPSSTGGDPMQLYLMSKDKIKTSHGAVALLVKLLSYELVIFIMAIIGFLTSYKVFINSLGNLKFVIFIGAFLNILVGTLYFLIIFFKPVILFIVELLNELLLKIRFKKREIFIENLTKWVDEYSNASTYLKKEKKVFIKIIFTTFVQFFLYYCIPYFVYLSLGFNNYSILTFISLQSVLFISVSSLPFPGAVGVSEATFMRIYKSMFPKTILGSAMVITRFINFYIFVLYSGIMMMSFVLQDNFKSKR